MTITPTPQPKPVAQAAESSPHTPTPWFSETHKELGVRIIGHPDNNVGGALIASVADGWGDAKGNAALICQAVNSRAALVAERDALVKALRNIADVAAKMASQSGSAQACFIRDEARQALANSGGAR